MEPVKRRPECRDAAGESRHGNARTGADMATRTSGPGAAHPLIRLLVTDITSSKRSNDRYLCGQPIKRAPDAQKLERRLQVFVRLQTSIRALLILASQSPFSFAEPTCSSATEEFFS